MIKRLKYNKKELNEIKKYYPISTKEELIKKFPNRSWDSICHQARKQGFKRKKKFIKYCKSYSNYSKLLKDNPIAYYWIGFLLADGHFTNRAIVIGLHLKDIEHIRKFREFIEYSGPSINKFIRKKHNREVILFSSSDYKLVPKIKDKFDISQRKTYNPPKDLSWIEKINPDLLISLIIGFIDGDGCLQQKQTSLTDNMCSVLIIGAHYSWENNLKYIAKFLFKHFNIKRNINRNSSSLRRTKDDFTTLVICNQIVLRELKRKTISLNLPCMERKWNKINENYQSIDERDNKIIPKIKELLKKDLSQSEISRRLKLSRKFIYLLRKRGKLD